MFLILAVLIISCKSNTNQEPILVRERKLQIKCDNERLLIENSTNNLEYSFDTIKSTKNYWKHVKYDQEKSMGHKLYPFTSIFTDTPSLYNKLNISLASYGDWKSDSRLRTFCLSNDVDSIRILHFYKRISDNTDTTEKINYAEIRLSFYKDNIQNLIIPLKKITGIYLSFQRKIRKCFSIKNCAL